VGQLEIIIMMMEFVGQLVLLHLHQQQALLGSSIAIILAVGQLGIITLKMVLVGHLVIYHSHQILSMEQSFAIIHVGLMNICILMEQHAQAFNAQVTLKSKNISTQQNINTVNAFHRIL